MQKISCTQIIVLILAASFPVALHAMDEFERKLHATFKLSDNSIVRFDDCSISIAATRPEICTQDRQYEKIVTIIDLREVEDISAGGRPGRQILKFEFNNHTREALERAKNKLMDRRFDGNRGDFNGTPLKRYARAEEILAEKGIRSGRRFFQCNGLKALSITTLFSDTQFFGGDFRDEVLERLLAELDACKAGM